MIFWFACGLVLLFFGGEMLIRGAESIGLRFGLSPMVVGLTIVALATSSPELFVSVDAALQGLGDVALGNVVGSNICNTALILGIGALIRPVRIEAQLMRLDTPVMILCCVVLLAMLADGVVGRMNGLFLSFGIVLYMILSVGIGKRDKAILDLEFTDTLPRPNQSILASVFLLIAGIAFLKFGSTLFVSSAVEFAAWIGVSQAVISLTLVSLGTSLPELVATVLASIRGRGDMAIGNAIGSSIFNILAVLGIAASISPIYRVDVSWVDLGVMTTLAVIVLPMLYTHKMLNRWEGLMLVLLYAGYVVYLLL